MSEEKNALPIDVGEAEKFLTLLADGGPITFQYFDDSKLTKRAGHFTKTLDEALPQLTQLNQTRCGIFLMVNEGTGHGRDEANVVRVRAVFVDLDHAPIEPVKNADVEPHIIVESSPGRYQAYWLVSDCPLTQFGVIQKALARKFGGDESVSDLPRVMRLPGSWHQKGKPFQVKILHLDNFMPYEIQDVINDLHLSEHMQIAEKQMRAPLDPLDDLFVKKIPEGQRHVMLLRYASKYAHFYGMGYTERKILIEGINKNCCVPPITDANDLERINIKAGQYAEEERSRNDAVDISKLLEKHKVTASEQRYTPLPDHLYNPPGMLGDTFRYIIETSTKPQPEIALAAAFAAVGTVIGRKVRTETNLRSNLYFLCLGETGSGKDRPRKAVGEIFYGIGAPNRSGVEDLSSDAAILAAVNETPSVCFLLDEFGRLLKTTKDTKNTFLYNINTLLLKLYGSAGGPWIGKNYADSKRNVLVHQPNVSILATTVERSFFEAVGREAIEDGLLNRMIFVQSTDPDPIMRTVKDFTPPESLLKQFQAWEDLPYRQAGNLSDAEGLVPEPRTVMATPEAMDVFDQFESDLRALRKGLRSEGFAGLFVRCREMALRIALICACAESIEAPTITAAHAEYATTFIEITSKNMLRAARQHVSENQIEAAHKAILAKIRAAGATGITMTALGSQTKHLQRAQRQAILQDLEAWECIAIKSEKVGCRPTQTLYYVQG